MHGQHPVGILDRWIGLTDLEDRRLHVRQGGLAHQQSLALDDAGHLQALVQDCSCKRRNFAFHLAFHYAEERIMAKGAMKAGKEPRKPKKDAKKPAPAPAFKAPPVQATKLKDK